MGKADRSLRNSVKPDQDTGSTATRAPATGVLAALSVADAVANAIRASPQTRAWEGMRDPCRAGTRNQAERVRNYVKYPSKNIFEKLPGAVIFSTTVFFEALKVRALRQPFLNRERLGSRVK